MAIPHYAYLVLKMPSPAGVLSLWANLSIAYACETENLALAEATDLSIQMAGVVTEANTVPADNMEILELEPPRASAKSKEIGKRTCLLPMCQRQHVCLEIYRHAGVPREKIEHSLNVSLIAKLIK